MITRDIKEYFGNRLNTSMVQFKQEYGRGCFVPAYKLDGLPISEHNIHAEYIREQMHNKQEAEREERLLVEVRDPNTRNHNKVFIGHLSKKDIVGYVKKGYVVDATNYVGYSCPLFKVNEFGFVKLY